MIILSIETSCDDTGIAIIKSSDKKDFNFSILSNIISSQIEIHKKWGGVYPTLAKREHQKNLVPVLTKALKQSKMLKKTLQTKPEKVKTLEKILEREKDLLKKLEKFLNKYENPNIDLITVTTGPGLEPCLWVGINFAKALSYYWNIPIIPVNHIEAHILANFVDKQQIINKKELFPAICLVVSGGHTQLILMKDINKYKILGETRDDAAGECFDKTAKILGLSYPGGPIIASEAEKCKAQSPFISLPRPMIYTKDYDFSFSGLKTAVLYKVKSEKEKGKNKKYIQKMAYEIQQAIIDVLIKKTLKAAKDYKAKTIILGGGVSANKELRKQFKEKIKKEMPDTKYLIPDSKLCTDNAVMIAITGLCHKNKKTSWKKLKAEANLRI